MSPSAPEVHNELKNQDPVIITASINDGDDPELTSVPRTVDEMVDSVVRSYEEGAAIAHLHGLYTRDENDNIEFDIAAWSELHDRIKEECDIITQLGLTIGSTEQRIEMLQEENATPDMLSITLNHNDHHWYGEDEYVFHDREEMIELTTVCEENGIMPELEVFHSGSVWNLDYLQKNGAVDSPYWVNMPFGMYGGVWSPGTPEQLDARRNLLPDDTRWLVSYFAGGKGSGEPAHQRRFHTYALTIGGNVRVGIEENAEYRDEPAEEATAALVSDIADIADHLYRGTATPDEARDLIGLPGN